MNAGEKEHYVNVSIIMLEFCHFSVCKGIRFKIILSPFDLQSKEVHLPKYQEDGSYMVGP